MAMFNYHRIVFCLLILNEASSFDTHFKDFYVESIKGLYEKSTYCDGNVTLKRRGREHPKVSIEIDLKDSPWNYQSDVKIYYSPMGNRRFILLPFKVVRHDVCDGFKYKFVRQEIQNLQNFSNLPMPSDQIEYCDLLQVGHYYVNNYIVDKSIFPTNTPTGRYRLVASAYRKTTGELVQAIEFLTTFT